MFDRISLLCILIGCTVNIIDSSSILNHNYLQEENEVVVFRHRKIHNSLHQKETLFDKIQVIIERIQRRPNESIKHLPGPEWRFVPEYLGAAFIAKPALRWNAPCFASDALSASAYSNNSIRIILNTADRKEGLGCGDAYMVASIGTYHVLEPHIGGSYVVEWEGLDQVWSHDINMFSSRLCFGPLNS
jgi:hypothetical protein